MLRNRDPWSLPCSDSDLSSASANACLWLDVAVWRKCCTSIQCRCWPDKWWDTRSDRHVRMINHLFSMYSPTKWKEDEQREYRDIAGLPKRYPRRIGQSLNGDPFWHCWCSSWSNVDDPSDWSKRTSSCHCSRRSLGHPASHGRHQSLTSSSFAV